MRVLTILPAACDRTRQQVSAHLDLELPELEIAAMERHLARCPACRLFANELACTTEKLRDADLVEPSLRFELPHRRQRIRISRVGTAVAAAALVIVTLGGTVWRSPSADGYLTSLMSEKQRLAAAGQISFVSQPSAAAVIPQGLAAAEGTTVDAKSSASTRSPSRGGAPVAEW